MGALEGIAAAHPFQNRMSALPFIRAYGTMPSARNRLAQQWPADEVCEDAAEALPASTKWHCEHGRGTRRDKAAKEQYLSPEE